MASGIVHDIPNSELSKAPQPSGQPSQEEGAADTVSGDPRLSTMAGLLLPQQTPDQDVTSESWKRPRTTIVVRPKTPESSSQGI